MTNKKETVESESQKLKTNELKWSKHLMEAGWTALPNVFIERQKAFGLDPTDLNILMHLALYWWTADNKPHPSKVTIADAMGVSPRTVQRRIAALEKVGLIKRHERRIPGKGSKTNIYDLDGLIKAAVPYAAEKIEEIANRKEERKERVKRRRATMRVVVSNDD